MSRIRSAYEAHESIIVALDRKREAAAVETPRRSFAMFCKGAIAGALLAAVWMLAYGFGG
jgi:hypothetical protein